MDNYDGDKATKLGILVPAAVLLLSAQASFLVAAARVAEAYGAASDAEKFLLAAPTGINAAWLSAARMEKSAHRPTSTDNLH